MDTYLLELVRYIHLNPLRAKAVKDLEELEDEFHELHRPFPFCKAGVYSGWIDLLGGNEVDLKLTANRPGVFLQCRNGR